MAYDLQGASLCSRGSAFTFACHLTAQLAKSLWPRSGPHQTRSSVPHTAWKAGTWVVFCRSDLANRSGSPYCHCSMWYVGQINVSGTFLLFGWRQTSTTNLVCGVPILGSLWIKKSSVQGFVWIALVLQGGDGKIIYVAHQCFSKFKSINITLCMSSASAEMWGNLSTYTTSRLPFQPYGLGWHPFIHLLCYNAIKDCNINSIHTPQKKRFFKNSKSQRYFSEKEPSKSELSKI